MVKLSVIMITKNAAATLEQSLASVHWADEIILVDSGSTDATLEIAKRYTDKIFTQPWLGFGPQKNFALAQATGQWILALDADEYLDPLLAEEIQACLKSPRAKVYTLPRRSKFCGRYIKYGAWRNDYVARLFERDAGIFSDVLVHEKLVYQGKILKLKQWLWHDSCDDLSVALKKMNHYSTLSAQMKSQVGKRSSLSMAILRGLFNFIQNYFFRLGFLDGAAGFMLAVATAEGCYYRYAKLFYLHQRMSNAKNY